MSSILGDLRRLNESENYSQMLDVISTSTELDSSPEMQYYHVVATFSIGERTNSFHLGEKYLEKMKHLNEVAWRIKLANRLGTYYWRDNQHLHARKYYQIALDIIAEADDPDDGHFLEDKGNIWNNMGVYYDLRGEILKSLECYKKSIDYKVRTGSPKFSTLINMGILFRTNNQLDRAKEMFLEALTYYNGMEEKYSQVLVLFHLIRTELISGRMFEAKSYLDQMWQLTKDLDDENVMPLVTLAEGIYLSNSTRLSEVATAIGKLEEVLKLPNQRYTRKILALRELARIRILEYKVHNDDQTWQEIEEIIQEMLRLSMSNQAYPTLVDIQILYARFYQSQKKYREAIIMLENGEKYIRKFNLDFLRSKLDGERKRIIAELERMQDLLNLNKKVADATEETDILDYLKSIKIG